MSSGGLSRWWGPVFEAERVIQARRWQGYALRSLFVLALLGGLITVGRQVTARTGVVTVRELATVGAALASILITLELTTALLIAPAVTAGAICLDKSRGSLAHLFVTDLTDREIVLGKLAARLFPVWGLLACAFPVAALATWLGGIDPVALARALLIVLSVTFLGSTFALMLSVWAGKPQEVISVVYAAWAVWLLDWPAYEIVVGANRPPDLIRWTHPFFLALGHLNYPHESFTIPALLFSLGCLVLGSICTAVAIRKVRVVGCRSPRPKEERARHRWRGLARLAARLPRRRVPDLDANPVLWREWHRNRPSSWSRRVWLGYWGLAAVVGLYLLGVDLFHPHPGINETPGVLLVVLVIFGLLLIGTATAAVLADERAQGSLDVLLAAPVSTRTIVWAKWRGAFRPVPRLAVWPLVVGLAYVVALPFQPASLGLVVAVPAVILAQGAALVSLGLALATWVKRPATATAWTIAVLVASVIGWLILGSTCKLGPTQITPGVPEQLSFILRREGLYMGSPFFNVGYSLVAAVSRNARAAEDRAGILVLAIGWTVIYALTAWLLFEATVATFDRSLGRAPERPWSPRLAPGPRPRAGPGLSPVEPGQLRAAADDGPLVR